MSDDDRGKIEQLAASMMNPTAGKIAQKISRHPATVHWYMLTHGLIEREPRRASRTYQRSGKTIHPYAPEHDDMILALRVNNLPYREIAARLTDAFGIERTGHSVQVRMIQLAAAPDEKELAHVR